MAAAHANNATANYNLDHNAAAAPLVSLLTALASPDNDIRRQAETLLNDHWITTQPAVLLVGLSSLLLPPGSGSPLSVEVRSFAAVLLRRIALKPPPAAESSAPSTQGPEITHFMNIGEDARHAIQSNLLAVLTVEQDSYLRRKVADTVSDVARYLLDNGGAWPELLQAIFASTKSPHSEHRESAFQLVANVPALVARAVNAATISDVFSQALTDSSELVRVAAIKAVVNFMLSLDEEEGGTAGAPAQYAALVPAMVGVLPPLLTTTNDGEELATDSLSYLMELAEYHPKLFRPLFAQLIPFIAGILTNGPNAEGEGGLSENTRHAALEFMLTFVEQAPGMVRKHDSFCPTFIPILLSWMAEIEEDEDWYTCEDIESGDDDNDENHVIAEQAMDRLARALGGKSVLPSSFAQIPGMLASPDWQKRHAALMAISAIGEGCLKIMRAEMDKIMSIVLPHLQDPHPRVRYAACNAVGQMSTDFSPLLQTSFTQPILTALLPVMDDVTFPRVQAHAAAALVNFSEDIRKETLEPYLDTIFEKLLILLNTGKTYVQEQAITTLATVADSAEGKFVKYYSAIMPILINVLNHAPQGKEFRLLRGKTIECASLIALAVGKETFSVHVTEFLTILSRIQSGITESDDPQSSYLLAAWARVAKVMGHDFLPYLDMVLEPLLVSAQLKPDVAVFDADDEVDETTYSPDEGWEFVMVEGQQIGIKTNLMEEKCTAVEMIICYAREMGAGFHPYVERVLGIVVPLLSFYFHEGVRLAAAATIPLLFSSLVKSGTYPRDRILSVWHDVCGKLISATVDEQDISFVAQVFTSLQECIASLQSNTSRGDVVPEKLMREFTAAFSAQLTAYFTRSSDRNDSRKDLDYDAEDEEVLQDQEYNDDALLSQLSRTMHEMFRSQGESYLPSFAELVPLLDAAITSSIPENRQCALCVYDDLVEFTGPTSASLQDHFLQPMIASLQDPSPDVRQSAAYGIGVCAQFGGAAYSSWCPTFLPALFSMVSAANSRSEECINATENAISAVGKILQYQGSSGTFVRDTVFIHWLGMLPILNDVEEACSAYTYLMSCLEGGDPCMRPPQLEFGRLAVILLQALATPDFLVGHPVPSVDGQGTLQEEDEFELSASLRLALASLVPRMKAALKEALSAVSADIKASMWSSLTAGEQVFLTQSGLV